MNDKEGGERLRIQRDKIKFVDIRFEIRQIVGSGESSGRECVPLLRSS